MHLLTTCRHKWWQFIVHPRPPPPLLLLLLLLLLPRVLSPLWLLCCEVLEWMM